MRLLAVNDEEEVRCSLSAVLRDNGYPAPVFANTCREALALLGPERPDAANASIDVLLMDSDLPGRDGPEASQQLRESPHLKDVPLLWMSGLPEAQAYESARAARAIDFVRKPLQAPEFLGRLHAACEFKRQLNECREHTRELERLNGELQRLCVVDELTGLANRRYFNRVVGQEWARAVREVIPFSIIMIDIDFFKDYNDLYGHQKGDECLRRVAAALNAVVHRPGDYVARYGGEEFAVILSHTGTQGALAVAEHLRVRVEALNLEHGRSSVHDRVTISLGVASAVPERSGSPDVVIEAADRATYEAKREGRNRVRAWAGIHAYVHPSHPGPRPHRP